MNDSEFENNDDKGFDVDDFQGTDAEMIEALGGTDKAQWLLTSLESSNSSFCTIPINNKFTNIKYNRLEQALSNES